jgi:hypothetical protein
MTPDGPSRSAMVALVSPAGRFAASPGPSRGSALSPRHRPPAGLSDRQSAPAIVMAAETGGSHTLKTAQNRLA